MCLSCYSHWVSTISRPNLHHLLLFRCNRSFYVYFTWKRLFHFLFPLIQSLLKYFLCISISPTYLHNHFGLIKMSYNPIEKFLKLDIISFSNECRAVLLILQRWILCVLIIPLEALCYVGTGFLSKGKLQVSHISA